MFDPFGNHMGIDRIIERLLAVLAIIQAQGTFCKRSCRDWISRNDGCTKGLERILLEHLRIDGGVLGNEAQMFHWVIGIIKFHWDASGNGSKSDLANFVFG